VPGTASSATSVTFDPGAGEVTESDNQSPPLAAWLTPAKPMLNSAVATNALRTVVSAIRDLVIMEGS